MTCQIKPMYIGDSPQLLIEAFEPDGVTPYPLTGHVVYVTAKRSQSDLDAAAVFQLSTTEGNVTVSTVPGETHTAIAVPPAADTAGLTANITVFLGVRVITPDNRPLTIFEGTLPLVRPTTLAIS